MSTVKQQRPLDNRDTGAEPSPSRAGELKISETTRRRMEEYLLHSEERLRIQYRCIPVPTVTWKSKGGDFVISDYNIAMEEFTDGLIKNYVGAKASEIFINRPDILDDFKSCFGDRKVVKKEAPYRLFTNKTNKFISFTFAYVPPDLVLLHMEDITPRKEAEAALLRSRQELRRLSARLLAAEEQERKRIARDLHDSIGQHLTAVKFNAENIQDLLAQGKDDLAVESLKAGVPIIRQTIEEVRRIIMGLRPTILDDLGILATISWLCREFRMTYGRIAVEQVISLREEEVPESLKITIYRLLQEALHNVAKHSGADHVKISLVKNGRKLRLTVADNGRGFCVAKIPGKDDNTGGIGLVGMRERTEFSGGRFKISSAPGRGTRLTAVWRDEQP